MPILRTVIIVAVVAYAFLSGAMFLNVSFAAAADEAASAGPVGVAAASSSALAPAPQRAPAMEVSTSLWDSVQERGYLEYSAVFKGASILDPGSAYTVDRNGDPSAKTGINLDGDVTAGYLFTRSLGAGVVVPFVLTPVMGRGAELGDVGVKGFDRKLLTLGDWGFSTSLTLQAPTSESSSKRGMDFAAKLAPKLKYRPSGSRFLAGLRTEGKAYVGAEKGKTFKLAGAPYVGYQLTRSLSLSLEYELELLHFVDDPSWSTFSVQQADLRPGVVWDVTSKIMLNPYLQVFTTTNEISMDRMALGAYVSARVL
jgi:hypothetical protein